MRSSTTPAGYPFTRPSISIIPIVEGEDRFSKALEPTDKARRVARRVARRRQKEMAEEEFAKSEDENRIRVERMDGDGAVLEDLLIVSSIF